MASAGTESAVEPSRQRRQGGHNGGMSRPVVTQLSASGRKPSNSKKETWER